MCPRPGAWDWPCLAGRERERRELPRPGPRAAGRADADQGPVGHGAAGAGRGAGRPRTLPVVRGFFAADGAGHEDARLLIKAGCFDELEGTSARPGLLWQLAADARGRERRRSAPGFLFEPPPRELPRPPGYDDQTMLRHEVETLGFIMSRHPLELYCPTSRPARGSRPPSSDAGLENA